MDQHGRHEYQLALSFPASKSLHPEMPLAPMRPPLVLRCLLAIKRKMQNPPVNSRCDQSSGAKSACTQKIVRPVATRYGNSRTRFLLIIKAV
jgi:hypothetical protein